MTVQGDLQVLAQKAARYLEEAENADSEATRRRYQDFRDVVMEDASYFNARSLEVLKLKASMLRDEDLLDRRLKPGVTSLIQSLLHDLARC